MHGLESSLIAKRFAQLAQDRGQQAALTFRQLEQPTSADQMYDFAKFWRRIERVTGHLQARLGVKPGQRVAWLGLNHEMQLVTLVACARLGALFLPLNFRLAPAEWQAVLADAGASVLIHDSTHQGAAQNLNVSGLNVIHQDELIATSSPRGLALPHVDEDAPVLLVYTSGTTGTPKGAVHTQLAVIHNARASAWAHGFKQGDKVLSTLPLFHVGGLCIQTLPALLAGIEVVLHPRFEPKAWLAELALSRPSLSLLVPATMRAVFEHPDWAHTDLSALRGIMTGSSTIPLDYLEAFHRRGVPVGQVYGSTETGPVSVVLGFDHAIERAGAAGWPHPEAQLRLLDAQGQDVPTGQTGEVCLRASNLMRGYWKAHGQVGLGLDDGWFRTGDLGRLDEDGCLTIVGRSKDMIISGGENIYPAEIENRMMGMAGIAECTVVGLPDVRWGEVPVAVVVRSPGQEGQSLDAERITQHLAAHIARFKLPRRVVFVEQLPKSALGKIQKPQVVSYLQNGHAPA
ncbi:MAG: hypothetical protein RL307_927 [Pseudomonadota bacterium]